MVHFMKEFRIVATLDYRGYYEDREAAKELNDQIADIAKHFNLAYTSRNRRVVDMPPEVSKRDNVVAFGTGKKLQLSWRCVTTPKGWENFCTNVNDYAKEKNYGTFYVYDSPCY